MNLLYHINLTDAILIFWKINKVSAADYLATETLLDKFLFNCLLSRLAFDAKGLGDAFFGALTLVSAVDDIADGGIGDAEASG